MSTLNTDEDLAFRQLAFAWVYKISAGGTRPLHRDTIKSFKNHSLSAHDHIIMQQGIWKPKRILGAISVTSSSPGRRHNYEDTFNYEGLLEYDFQSSPVKQHENDWLRLSHQFGLPLIYFRAVRQGYYTARFPSYVVGIDEDRRKAILEVPNEQSLPANTDSFFSRVSATIQPRYSERLTKRRLHQDDFRSNILLAYETTCAVCNLKRPQLLDASHIKPDSQGGSAEITNGLSLCKIHHSAYDSNLLGIAPDHKVRISGSVLGEKDGPMLKHGLQGHHGERLVALPASKKERPDRDLLAERFEEFKASEA